MRRFFLLVLLVTALGGTSGTASAQVEGYYVGVGAGGTDWNAALDTFDDGTLTGGTVDGKDDGWKVFLGYRFSKYLGVEGGYSDLGSVSFRGNSSGCANPADCFYTAGPVALERQADGFYGQAVISWPIGRFDVFGKVGFFALDIEYDPGDVKTAGDYFDATETVWGFGGQYRFGGPMVRLEWERITEVPDDSVDFLSASLLYRFGGK